MNAFLASLDSRDIAFIVWGSVFLIWMFSKSGVRVATKELLSFNLHPILAICFISAFLYFFLATYLQMRVGAWTPSQLKASIVWFIAAGVPSLFKISELSTNPDLIRTMARQILSATVFIEAYLNIYKFPLPVELVFFPAITAAGVMQQFAQINPDHKPVEKMMTNILILTGVIVLGYQTYKLVVDPEHGLTANSARDFAIPILNSFLFLPFIWLWGLYGAYDHAFAMINVRIKNKELHGYTKRSLLFAFRTRVKFLKVWLRLPDLYQISDRSGVDKSIRMAKRVAV